MDIKAYHLSHRGDDRGGCVTSEVLKQKSFPDEQYDRCFYLLIT